VGLLCVIFAGPLARILTFDSEPKVKSPDFTEQMLRPKDKVPNQSTDPTP
jgi:hypothetical protein